jgi:hypothetical protein
VRELLLIGIDSGLNFKDVGGGEGHVAPFLAVELEGIQSETVAGDVEARDGIEPPNKALQTLPFSFWVPRHLD